MVVGEGGLSTEILLYCGFAVFKHHISNFCAYLVSNMELPKVVLDMSPPRFMSDVYKRKSISYWAMPYGS